MTDGPLADRLRRLFAADPAPLLDRVAATIAQLDDDPPGEAAVLGELDRLAAGVPPGGDPVRAVLGHLFDAVGLAGAVDSYYDPANSYLHRVIERRRGIPITLAVVAIEVGRRLGVELTGVGLPGHFLVGDGRRPERWFDPFAAGRALDRVGCRALFAGLHPEVDFDDGWLEPVGTVDVAHRMLQNLRLIHLRAGDPGRLVRVLELRAAHLHRAHRN